MDYNYYGLRTTQDDEQYKVGDVARNSLDWDFEMDTSSDQELPGTCAVRIDSPADAEAAIKAGLGYGSGTVVLLGSNWIADGHDNDPGEIVMIDAVVLVVYPAA